MDFMGIGPLELLLILLLGFLFLGPDRLPGMAAKAGRLYRNFKKATFDLSKTITEELPTKSSMDDIKKTITKDLIDEPKVEKEEKPTEAPTSTPTSAPSENINE